MKQWIVVLGVVLAEVLGACAGDVGGVPPEGATGVRLELSAVDESVVEYRLINGSDVAVRVARWRTPLATAPDRFFEVTRDGEEVRYTGPIVTRLPPGEDSYVVLAPGETIAVEVDLGDWFDLTGGGELEVRSAFQAADVITADSEIAADFGSAEAWLYVTPEAAAARNSAVAVQSAELVAQNCRDGKAEALQGVTLGAAWSLYDALVTYTRGSNRANHYFGVGYHPEATETVLYGMWSVLADPNLTYTCMRNFSYCAEPDMIAFVMGDDVANSRHVIYVCDLFFDPAALPGEGDDTVSTWGAVLHEAAHLAGAPLEGYGYDQVRNIALTTPQISFLYADSYRYYVTNIKGQ